MQSLHGTRLRRGEFAPRRSMRMLIGWLVVAFLVLPPEIL
jgi:hypothetical protein